MKKGDVLTRRHGPWEAYWVVVDVTAAGAVLEPVGGDGAVRYVGWEDDTYAPGGAFLARRDQDFVGRAHWPSVKRVENTPNE